MAMQDIGHEANVPTRMSEGSEAMRAELCRIVDEMMDARADRAKTLRARFDQLWADLGSHRDPTVR
ncbi:hypothetical protein [Anaeromyxobacter oryzisoli]|jgi:hypothetical protein|uniref:hypothetical protein n=1 Tax=Anaeromyxobacter oryzisoli TaxID=2925408 RepID=UPI001F567E41|nr:hypothetical protein [Anaeromyxobacter sp. SG63]